MKFYESFLANWLCFGQIYTVIKGQASKNNLGIWSHWGVVQVFSHLQSYLIQGSILI